MIPIGWDALVAITHKDNTLINGISREQLKDVLTGTLPYRYGFALLNTDASTRYLQALDVIEKSGIYTASGH